HRTPGNHVLERDTVKKFHDKEGLARLLADVINRADIRVIQGRSRFGFAPESLKRLAVIGEIFGQKPEGDEASEAGVFGFVNHSHTTSTELFDDLVVRDGLV